MPVTETAPQLLACKSFMMGTCNLLVIGLPAGSRLRRGPFPPEVDRWRVVGDVSWATSGRTSFRAWLPGRGPGVAPPAGSAGHAWRLVEGRVEIEPLGTRAAGALEDPARALASVHAQGTAILGGHEGRWAAGAVRRGGLLRPRPGPALAVSLACPGTRRQVRVIMEADAEEPLRTVLGHLEAALACH